VCSLCLQKLVSTEGDRQKGGRKVFGYVLFPFWGITAVLFVWSFFYLIGSLLLTLSASAANRGH